MLTLGFHNPFAVLGKESPKPETRASAQGASYPGVLRRALSPKSPPRSRRGSADLASPRSPPKVTQASQSDGDADGTPQHGAADDVAPMVEAGTPLKAFLNALVNAEARALGVVTVIDGAQAVPHFRPDVQALDCDFYAFSSHKMFGPTGIGVLYGKEALLEAMPPYQGGGEMIERVSFERTTWNQLPYKFEAGTPAIAEAVGLGAAIDYLDRLDRTALAAAEDALLARANALVDTVPGMEIIGTARRKVPVLSFKIAGLHPSDIGTLLDQQGIAIRTGHHCAMPLMDFYAVPGTARASFAFYNTLDEVEQLFAGLRKIQRLFA